MSAASQGVAELGRQQYFSVENFQAVYADVEGTWQDPQRAALYHRLLGKVLNPNTQFGPGVEDRIEQELENGARAAIAFTHGSMVDPPQIAAMAELNDVFEPLKGKTMIGAKVPIFAARFAPVLWRIVPDLGAYPVWRKKDVLKGKKRESEEEKARLIELQKASGRASIALEISGVNNYDLHLAKHVEGTRNRDNPLKILTVRDGYGRTLAGVDPSIDILMVTAAFYYGKGGWRKPTIYLDIPENQRRDDYEEITRTITPSLQYTLDQAVLLDRQ